MNVRLLLPANPRPRVLAFFRSLADAAPRFGVRVSMETGDVLLAWGCGDPCVAEVVRQHQARGLRSVCWDVGYWGKSFRVAFDGAHPTTLPNGDASRFDALGMPLREDADPAGPIVLVGLGPKSRHMDSEYEERTLRQLRALYPDRKVLFRPKPNRAHVSLALATDATSPIDDVLRGASLVVCRHSNVGVDACLAGVPVVCEGGAPALLYGSDLSAPVVPSPAERLAFLRRLAWLNWWDTEVTQLWPWLKRELSERRSATG